MISHYLDSSHLYNLMEMQRAAISPFNVFADVAKHFHSNPLNPFSNTDAGRSAAAAFELFERVTRHYGEPDWGINHTKIEGKNVKVKIKKVRSKTFCHLMHFQKESHKRMPKLLIVAPMSGHYATLLRGTVEATLPFYDVYITDWQNPRDIPLSKGPFDLDDYIDYVIDFLEFLGPKVHVMAVCQPSVPVMAAVSIMSAENNPKVPLSMTLIGGPIDTRINPTQLNDAAVHKPFSWFKKHVITRVPFNYQGFMREVYPGFIQLTSFMSMNMDKHVEEHTKFFNHLIEGDGDSAAAHRKFYNEYLSVMDLPAEFYLQTLQVVFKEHALPKGTWVSRGRKIDPTKIKKTALMCVEGELDDISGTGQTKAAIKLCKGLPDKKKKYHFQKAVGHYGSFNGRKFREKILPEIVAFTSKQDKAK